MPIYNSVGGITGLTIENDPSALKLANNLSDLPNLTTARTNLQLSTYFAALGHNHSGTYSPVGHNHDGTYAAVGHNHDGTYAPVSHTHPVSDVTGWGSLSGASNGYVLSWNGSALVWVAQSGGGSGDRYLTTSTTSLTIDNANKTLTVQTGLSYTPTQNVTIAYDASNHMHGEVLTYDSGTGVMTVDVNNHTGTGTYAAWTVNVGGVTPATSVAWGSVTGTLSSQTDLQTALNAKQNKSSLVTVSTSSNYYATAASENGVIYLDNSSAGIATVYLPDGDTGTEFTNGCSITIINRSQSGFGPVTINTYGSAFTHFIYGTGSVNYDQSITCSKISGNDWFCQV